MKKINDLRSIEGGMSFTGSGLSGLVTPIGTIDFTISKYVWYTSGTGTITSTNGSAEVAGTWSNSTPVLGAFCLTNALGTFGWDLTGIFSKITSLSDFLVQKNIAFTPTPSWESVT